MIHGRFTSKSDNTEISKTYLLGKTLESVGQMYFVCLKPPSAGVDGNEVSQITSKKNINNKQQSHFIAPNDLLDPVRSCIKSQIRQTISVGIELSPNMPKKHLNTHTLQLLNLTKQLLEMASINHILARHSLPAITSPLEDPVRHALNQILRVGLDDHRRQISTECS